MTLTMIIYTGSETLCKTVQVAIGQEKKQERKTRNNNNNKVVAIMCRCMRKKNRGGRTR